MKVLVPTFVWMNELLHQFTQTTFLEWTGVLLAVVQVVLAKRNHVGLYPFGIASVVITMYVLAQAGLYAEVLLNAYYFIMSVYGWMHWVRAGSDGTGVAARSELAVTRANTLEWWITAIIVLAGCPLVYFALVQFTDSTVPLWDAWVTSTAWAGMWLLARRKLENWILLNISNAFAIPLLAQKGLILYAILTVYLFIVAIFGFMAWKKILIDQQNRNGEDGKNT